MADRFSLQSAYNYLSKRIWDVDPDRLIFFAGVTWDDIFKAGFKSAPGGKENAYRSVFAFHYYEPPQFKKQIKSYFKRRVKDAKRLKTGAMLTETEIYYSSNTDPCKNNIYI